MKSLSRVWLFVIPWTVALQGPPSMGFSRQEYWSGIAISFSRESSKPRDRTWVSHITHRCCTLWATREVQKSQTKYCIGQKVPLGFEENISVNPRQVKALVQGGVTSFPWETLELLTLGGRQLSVSWSSRNCRQGSGFRDVITRAVDSMRGDPREEPASRCDLPRTRHLLLGRLAVCPNPCLAGEAVLSSVWGWG